jgi:hypothetical protein
LFFPFFSLHETGIGRVKVARVAEALPCRTNFIALHER